MEGHVGSVNRPNSGGKDDPWGSVQGMAESLRRLEWYSGTDAEYIKRNEVSIYWDWMGVRCKARLDSVLVDEGIVLTSRPPTPSTPNCSPRRWSTGLRLPSRVLRQGCRGCLR